MQLNALFCCLWRNVETFVVFFRNQHHRLLPVMCHNLRDGGRGPPATVFTTLACCSINKGSQARQSQNRDFCLPHLHSTPQLGGLLSEYCYAVWHGNTRMVWLPNGEKILICLFVLTLLINVTDRHTYIQTSHDGKGCAYAQHRVAKMAEKQFVIV